MDTPQGTACRVCGGNGELHTGDTTVSPFSGVAAVDPQRDAYVVCHACRGTGEAAA